MYSLILLIWGILICPNSNMKTRSRWGPFSCPKSLDVAIRTTFEMNGESVIWRHQHVSKDGRFPWTRYAPENYLPSGKGFQRTVDGFEAFPGQSLINLQSKRNDEHLRNLIFRFQLAERLILKKLNSIRDPASASRDGVSDLEHYINKNFDPDQRSRTKNERNRRFWSYEEELRNSEVTINIRSRRFPVLVQRPTVFQIRVRNLKRFPIEPWKWRLKNFSVKKRRARPEISPDEQENRYAIMVRPPNSSKDSSPRFGQINPPQSVTIWFSFPGVSL